MLILDRTDHIRQTTSCSTSLSTVCAWTLNALYISDKELPFCITTCSLSLYYCCSIHLHHHLSHIFIGRTQNYSHLINFLTDHMCVVVYMYLARKLREALSWHAAQACVCRCVCMVMCCVHHVQQNTRQSWSHYGIMVLKAWFTIYARASIAYMVLYLPVLRCDWRCIQNDLDVRCNARVRWNRNCFYSSILTHIQSIMPWWAEPTRGIR